MNRYPDTKNVIDKVGGKSCNGLCCKKFYLPISPTELQEEARKATLDPLYKRYNPREVKQIAAMVIPLGFSKKDVNGKTWGDGEGGWYYTCMYHDDVSGRCLIYDHRPNMCSEYPYGKACRYNKCVSNPWWQHYDLTRWVVETVRALVSKWKYKNKRKEVLDKAVYSKHTKEKKPLSVIDS